MISDNDTYYLFLLVWDFFLVGIGFVSNQIIGGHVNT